MSDYLFRCPGQVEGGLAQATSLASNTLGGTPKLTTVTQCIRVKEKKNINMYAYMMQYAFTRVAIPNIPHSISLFLRGQDKSPTRPGHSGLQNIHPQNIQVKTKLWDLPLPAPCCRPIFRVAGSWGWDRSRWDLCRWHTLPSHPVTECERESRDKERCQHCSMYLFMDDYHSPRFPTGDYHLSKHSDLIFWIFGT